MSRAMLGRGGHVRSLLVRQLEERAGSALCPAAGPLSRSGQSGISPSTGVPPQRMISGPCHSRVGVPAVPAVPHHAGPPQPSIPPRGTSRLCDWTRDSPKSPILCLWGMLRTFARGASGIEKSTQAGPGASRVSWRSSGPPCKGDTLAGPPAPAGALRPPAPPPKSPLLPDPLLPLSSLLSHSLIS